MNNTLDKLEYIKINITYIFITFCVCKSIFFRCLPNCTYQESLIILLILIVFVGTLGIKTSWKFGRNYTNVLVNIILVWGCFVIVAYSDIYKKRMLLVGVITLIVTLIMVGKILLNRNNGSCRRKGRLKKRIIRCIRRNIAVCILLSLGMKILVHGTYLNSKIEVTKVYGDEHCLDANIEVIANIDPERWEKLDVQERLDTAQAIVNCQARFVGVSHEISVGIKELDAGNLGYYNEAQHQIVIDINYLKSNKSIDILKTCIHEVEHAYQYEQVALYRKLDKKSRNLLMFYNVSIYAEELANYQNGDDENFWLYYGQKVEVDARRVAEIDSQEYIEHVNEYLGKDIEGN